MERDQSRGAGSKAASPVRLRAGTKYGLGEWLDRMDDAGQGIEISSPGAFGFCPWIDREHDLLGVLVVEVRDRRARAGLGGVGNVQEAVRRIVVEAAGDSLALTGRGLQRRKFPSRSACQTSPVPTSSAVSQPPPWQNVSMHLRWPRSRTSPPFCDVWPMMTVLPDSCLPGVRVPERLPPQHGDGLTGSGDVREVVGVDEDVGLGLVEVQAAFEELEVLLRDEGEIPA